MSFLSFIFIDLFKDVFDPQSSQSSPPPLPKKENENSVDLFPEGVESEDTFNDDPAKNMAEKMKQSNHLYLKIASKYMEPKPDEEQNHLELCSQEQFARRSSACH